MTDETPLLTELFDEALAQVKAARKPRRGGSQKLDPKLLEARGTFRNDSRRRDPEYTKPGFIAPSKREAIDAALEQVEQAERPKAPASGDKDYVALGTQYARDVIAGKLPACRFTRLACERHFRDLERIKGEGFPFRFDVIVANEFSANGERYPHIKGKWAAKKQRLSWEPWQCFTMMQFGWVHKETGKRRFTEFYLRIPRKNAKSTMAAAIGNNLLLDDGEHAAEVYAGATTEKQAWEVFGPARLMLKGSLKLCSKHNVEILSRSIVKMDDASRFWPLIGKPGDGASPSCAIVDEYHEHNTSELFDTMQTGMGAREQPVLLVITTAGTNLASPCYDKDKEAQKVLEQTFDNDRMFAIIYSIDEKDDWKDPNTLRKANPNYDVSVSGEWLVAQQKQAVINPAYQNRFRTKHLNEWCNASVAGINMAAWRKCADPSLSIDRFRGDECLFILDLASKIDICAFVQLFTREINGLKHYYAFGKYYLPEQTIEETRFNQLAYQKWVHQLYLISTPGSEIDFDLLSDEVKYMSTQYQVAEVVYDPWRATQLAHQLAKDGAITVEMGQTARNMGAAFDELLSAVKAGRFHHDGNPVLEWMASNVVAKTVTKGLVVPAKEKAEAKIDGIVAIVMGVSRAMVREPSGGMDDFLQSPVVVMG